MTRTYTILLFFILSAISSGTSVYAKSKEIEISGLVLDDTISRQGHDFATQLGRFWQEIPNTFGKNVIIKEIIVPQAGTRLDVVFDNKIVYRTFLGRRLLPLDEKVGQAVYRLVDAVAQVDGQSSSPDLADDEW